MTDVPPPSEPLAEPRAIETIVAEGYRVEPWRYLQEGWRAFTEYPHGFIGFALLLFVVSQALPILLPASVGQPLSLAVQVIMMAGIALMAWRQMGKRGGVFRDFFPDWPTAGRLLLCTLLGLLLIIAGFFLLIIPGIYLLIGYTFSYMLIVDRRMSAWEALEASRRVVGRNWWGVLGLTAVVLLLIGVGALAGGLILGVPLGSLLAGSSESVNLADLPLVPFETAGRINKGLAVGMISGAMVGTGLALALAGCMLGAAYAEIFGLSSQATSRRISVSPWD